jgi:hypothetical protein
MMNAMTHPVRTLAALALCFGSLVAQDSCKLPHTNTLPASEFTAGPTGTDLSVTARFLDASDDAPGFFRTLLPDSGIYPLHVVLRNDGAGRFVIHSANGMELGPGFEGIALFAQGKKHLPLHPRQVAEILVGVRKTARYRPPGAFQFFAGSLVAPLGGYYIYGEIDVGRYYRPLFKHSLYLALESGMVEPILLGPGEERSGYLYFAIPAIRDGAPCELRVRACAPIEVRDTLAGYDFRFARNEMSLEVGVDSSGRGTIPLMSDDSPHGLLFKLAKQGPSGKPGLYGCSVRQSTPDANAPWMLVAPILSQSAFIADASCGRSIAACAVNFKSKSKVFVVQCGDAVKLVGEKSFSRNVKRLWAVEAGIFVLTGDDICHFLEYPSLAVGRSVRLGQDIEDAALVDGNLFVFSRGRRLELFGTTGDALMKPIEQHSLRRGKRTVIGTLNDELLVLNGGSRARGDTLAIFGIEPRAEMRRGALPGKVDLASTDGSSLIVQLEDGTLLRIVRAPHVIFKIAEAGYLPFESKELRAVPPGFIAVDARGACASGAVGDFKPGVNSVLEVSVTVR